MKKNRTFNSRLILSLIVFLCISEISFSQNCVKLVYPHDPTNNCFNPDSVMVDTCNSSPTFGLSLAKKFFYIMLTDFYYPFNTVIQDGQIFTSDSIKNNYFLFKNSIKQIEDSIGNMFFIRTAPGFQDETDSIRLLHPLIFFYLSEYQPIDKVLLMLGSLDSILSVDYISRKSETMYTLIPPDQGMAQNLNFSDIDPGFTGYSHVPKNFKPRGLQQEMYDVNCPLAWEITLGGKSNQEDDYASCIAIGDFFGGDNNNNELLNNFLFTKPNGTIDNTVPGDHATEHKDRLSRNIGLTGHGINVASMCSSGWDNSTSIKMNPMVGSAPKAKFIEIQNGFESRNSNEQKRYIIYNSSDYDIDKTNNYSKRLVDVHNMSFGSIEKNKWLGVNEIIANGIIVVVAAGNYRDWMSGTKREPNINCKPIQRSNGKIDYSPAELYPAAHVFNDVDPSDARYDTKPIAVGATRPGRLFGDDCNTDLSNFSLVEFESNTFKNPHFTDEIQFQMNFNFSPGTSKFPNQNVYNNENERFALKEAAFVDLVAPGYNVLSSDWVNHYMIVDGTSYATPIVSGIVALMTSIHRGLGKTNSDIQRKAYDILTFTAKKIPDANNIERYDGTWPRFANNETHFYSWTDIDDNPYQFEYVEQINDKLHRWWAQRVGFGLVDAYRAVAHSIINKAEYEYNNNDLLLFNNSSNLRDGNENPDGKQLMHMGSKVKVSNSGVKDEALLQNEIPIIWVQNENIPAGADVDILEFGGTSFPDAILEEQFNNQGVTNLNSDINEPINLTVADNQILAIDGILKSSQPELNHRILSIESGKILMAGYLLNVGLEGNIKVGDIYIDSRDDINGYIKFNQESLPGEIFGKVFLKNLGRIILSNSLLVLQPGGEIVFKGSNGIEIPDGSTLELAYGSAIRKDPANTNDVKIVIKSGGKLVVQSGAAVMLDIHVEVQDGGELLFEESSLVTLKKFTIKNGGTFTISPKCTLRLIDEESYCNGNLLFNGTPQNQILITSVSESQKENMCDNSYQNFTQIICSGSPFFDPNTIPNLQPTSIKLKNVDFNSVSIKASNYLFPLPVENCNFKTNTVLLPNNVNTPNSFLELSGIEPISIINCTFRDSVSLQLQTNFDWLTWDKQTDPNLNIVSDQNYYYQFTKRLNGITLSGFLGVSIDNSSLFQFDKTKAQNDPQYPSIDNLEIPDKHHFVGLNTGIYTTNCARVEIKNCNFLKCRAGNNDYSSSVWLCQNTSHRVNTPNSLNQSKRWRTSDNNFNQSNKVANLFNLSTGQDFTSNIISDFYNGFFIQNGLAIMRNETLPLFIIPPYMVLNGMNNMEIPNRNYPYINDYSLDVTKSANPFTSSSLNKFDRDERADFFLSHKDANILIDHGYNYMSNFTNKHIFYDNTNQDDPPSKSIDLSYNNWQPGTLRLANVMNSNSNDPINTVGAMQTNCYFTAIPISGIENQYFDPCSYFSRNTGKWAFLSSTDSVLDNDFYAYLNDFCNGILSCECYRQRLFDLMQLAVLGNSVNEKLQMVIDCINDKNSDPVYSYLYCDATNLLLLLGEAYERSGLIDEAENTYLNIVTNSSNPSDTMLARWRLMNLEAIKADSTFGFVYDSLMTEYYMRVDRDITATTHGSSSPPPPPAIMQNNDNNQQEPEIEQQNTGNSLNSDEKKNISNAGQRPVFSKNLNEPEEIAILEQNSPNPFTNETVIVFYLNREADVRLGIHNALGHTIKEVVNQHLRRGKYIYTFQNENNASGVYLYLLTTDGKQIVKKMQLVK